MNYRISIKSLHFRVSIPNPGPTPLWKFFIRYIEQWTKTFCKKPVDRAGQKPVDRPVKNRSTGQSTGDDFEIYRSGRVEKILTGSISVAAVLCR